MKQLLRKLTARQTDAIHSLRHDDFRAIIPLPQPPLLLSGSHHIDHPSAPLKAAPVRRRAAPAEGVGVGERLVLARGVALALPGTVGHVRRDEGAEVELQLAVRRVEEHGGAVPAAAAAHYGMHRVRGADAEGDA
jgi:hypothetical protein